jgi:hypothetical protein
MTASDLLEQPCNKLLTACSKLVDNLGQAVRTQLVDAGCWQTCYNEDMRFLRSTLLISSDLLQGCSNKSDTVMI